MIHPRTAGAATQTDLVLLEHGSEDIPRERARLEALLRRGHRLFVFDPRGRGAVAVRPINPRDLEADYGTEYKLASDAMLLGISTLGLRVFDVLRGLIYLRAREDSVGGRLGVYGVVDEVTICDSLYSYRDLVENRYYDDRANGVWSIAWGFLRHFDLPDLMTCLPASQVTLISPRGAAGAPADPAAVRTAYGQSRVVALPDAQ